MAHISRRGTPTQTVGDLPAVGTKAPGFTLAGSDLSDVTQGEWAGRRLVLNIFPSIDTATCATSVRKFNFRPDFGDVYGVRILDGGLRGLLARAVVVIDTDGTVLHTELVDDTGHEPDYDAAIAAL